MTHHDDNAGHDDTASKFKWKGTWNEFKGKVQQQWGQMTNDDMDVAEGEYKEMLGRIQRKTGESMEEIERKLG